MLDHGLKKEQIYALHIAQNRKSTLNLIFNLVCALALVYGSGEK